MDPEISSAGPSKVEVDEKIENVKGLVVLEKLGWTDGQTITGSTVPVDQYMQEIK